MDLRTIPLWLCSLAPLAQAQTPLVLPASHTGSEGTSSTNVPFGRSTPVRLQMVYHPILFAGAGTVTELAFRLDGNATAASKQVDCEIQMGYLNGSLVNLGADFAGNRQGSLLTVLPRQVVTLPAQTTASVPSPFLAPLVLATPFPYDPQLGALLIEVIVYAQPPGAYTLDTTYVCDSPEVPIGPLGCALGSATPLTVTSATTQVIWGRPWVAQVTNAPAGALAILALGTRDSGNWQGLTLPADLGVLGAPGCYLSIDVVGTFFLQAANDGTAAFPLNIPNNPVIVGVWLRYQAAALDANANALGIVTSQAKKVQVCGWEPVGRVWASGLSTTTGSREIGVAPVLRLTLQ